MSIEQPDLRNRKQQDEKYIQNLDEEKKIKVPLWKRIFCCFSLCPASCIKNYQIRKKVFNDINGEIELKSVENFHIKKTNLEVNEMILKSEDMEVVNNDNITTIANIAEHKENDINEFQYIKEIEKIKENLRIISSLQKGQKLKVSYYGLLIVDLSYIPSVTRMITGNNKNNTIEQVEKTILDSIQYKNHDDIKVLINDGLKNGLNNLLDTYKGSSVEERINNLINKLL